MKNNYITKMQIKQKVEIEKATQDGFDFAMSLVAIALNNTYSFGYNRLMVVENECVRLMDEEFGRDTEDAAYGMKKRLDQIKNKARFADSTKDN